MIPLTKSPQYKKFTADRNRALENILQKKLIQLDGVVDRMKAQVLDYTAAVLINRGSSPRTNKEYETQIQQLADQAWQETVLIAAQIRRVAYTLSYSGELEAIARSTQSPVLAKLDRAALSKKMDLPSPSGGSVVQRTKLAYDRLARKILNAYQLSRVLNDEIRDAMQRVEEAFPRQRTIIRPKKKLKAREAAPPRRFEDVLVSGFIDDDLWQEALDSYLADASIAVGRGPDDITRVRVGKDKVERYTWEVEKEITEDFVNLVRQGQVDAATDNGITDFVWIAVVDDRTDECCLWRDGLTTKEIEAQLRGKRRDDECQTTVPPAHFNCRCDIAPMTKDIPANKPEPLGDFETWFTKK